MTETWLERRKREAERKKRRLRELENESSVFPQVVMSTFPENILPGGEPTNEFGGFGGGDFGGGGAGGSFDTVDAGGFDAPDFD
jgi:hypothetical protein